MIIIATQVRQARQKRSEERKQEKLRKKELKKQQCTYKLKDAEKEVRQMQSDMKKSEKKWQGVMGVVNSRRDMLLGQ